VVVSIDALECGDRYEVYTAGGSTPSGLEPAAWARRAQESGAGEILINAIHRDGEKSGYDLTLVGHVTDAVRLPVIACGGVGQFQHFADALTKTNVDAVAAANIFHYREQSVYHAKKFLYDLGLNVRRPELLETHAA
jgi:imidazole glycerol-phosphate synthase subunit HisF